MILNILNVEDLVFHDDDLWRMMPDLTQMRDQWRISKLSPSLRATGRRAMSDFLRAAKGRYEDVISAKLGVDVTIDNIDNRVVRNLEFGSDEDFPQIDSEGVYSGFSTYREGSRVFMTLWR